MNFELLRQKIVDVNDWNSSYQPFELAIWYHWWLKIKKILDYNALNNTFALESIGYRPSFKLHFSTRQFDVLTHLIELSHSSHLEHGDLDYTFVTFLMNHYWPGSHMYFAD